LGCRTRNGARRRTRSWCCARPAPPPPEELIAFTREHLAHFKAPHGVTFVEELPKTATGKIQKFVLRQGAPNLARQ
jgi:acyl-coenzyme A synthetase/AMP-(fatty) acid ligase